MTHARAFPAGSPRLESVFRLLGVLLTVLFAIATAIVTWPQFFRLERSFPFAQLVAVRGWLVVGFALVLVLALLLSISRRMRGFAASIAIIALLGGGASAVIGLTRGIGPGEMPEPTDASIRVMTWNTAGEAVSAERIAQEIVSNGADIVTLPETSEEVGERIALMMREQGQPMWVHHVQFNPEVTNGPQSWFTTILISPELGDYSVIPSSTDGTSNTGSVPSAVVMPIDGHGPTVVAVHAVAPRPDEMDQWRSDLQWVADQCPGGNVILAGDFNATLDHMSGLGVDGGDMGACRDAAARTGNGLSGTWPASLPALAGSPIDHIMATPNWTPTGSHVLSSADSRSDHRAVVVQYEPAG